MEQHQASTNALAARYLLDDGWEFQQSSHPDQPWRKATRLPTEIFQDLKQYGLTDPFIAKGENDVQWVGETGWVYRTRIPLCLCTKHRRCRLVFEGLDTFATVKLQGELLLRTDNMFTPYAVDITDFIASHHYTQGFLLEIEFESAWLEGKKIVGQYPEHQWGCWNGDPSRLAVRKAQYHYVRHS